VISVIPVGKISKYPRDIDILSCAGLCRIAEKSLAVASRSELSDRVASFPGKFRAPIARLAHFPDRRNDIPRALSPCVSRISRRRDPPSALPSPPARHKFRFSRPPGSGDTDPRNPRYCNFYPTPLQDPYGSLDVSPMPRRSLSSLPPLRPPPPRGISPGSVLPQDSKPGVCQSKVVTIFISATFR
jgi:hypothetical protein